MTRYTLLNYMVVIWFDNNAFAGPQHNTSKKQKDYCAIVEILRQYVNKMTLTKKRCC